jgi:hypothetical protein
MVREVASKTSDVAGDATTTATVLDDTIVRDGAKLVAAGRNPMDLKRGIDRGTSRAGSPAHPGGAAALVGKAHRLVTLFRRASMHSSSRRSGAPFLPIDRQPVARIGPPV